MDSRPCSSGGIALYSGLTHTHRGRHKIIIKPTRWCHIAIDIFPPAVVRTLHSLSSRSFRDCCLAISYNSLLQLFLVDFIWHPHWDNNVLTPSSPPSLISQDPDWSTMKFSNAFSVDLNTSQSYNWTFFSNIDTPRSLSNLAELHNSFKNSVVIMFRLVECLISTAHGDPVQEASVNHVISIESQCSCTMCTVHQIIHSLAWQFKTLIKVKRFEWAHDVKSYDKKNMYNKIN